MGESGRSCYNAVLSEAIWKCFAYITCIRLYGYGYTFKGLNMQCSIYGHIYFVSLEQIADKILSISSPLKCSLAFYKCVQRNTFPHPTPRLGVQTHYYGPRNAWVVRCLSWKTISNPWFGRDYWHGGRADNSNSTATNAKYSNCKGVNHETYDVSLQNLRSRPFWILSPLQILFLSILRLFTCTS